MTEAGKRRGEASREAILAAAESVFAEHGFDGARVDVIAHASGYDKKLIFRYFGDKLGLYTEVLKRADQESNTLLARIFAPLLAEEPLILQAQQFKSFLTSMLYALFDYLLEHPRFVRIMTWEMAEGWQIYTQIASQFPHEDLDQFERLFHKARSAGLLRSDYLPAIQLSTITQLCLTYLSSLPLYKTLLPGEDLSSRAGLERAREYIVAFVVAGMMADPTESRPEKGMESR
ncbi:TetR/AcrR family transcriptional regulator [Ktedonobacter robiniae]|uniref:TetR family transcriptional regulator n=1 Tax=Ktedonobacter robiniae TaxID=2778365 RepID=A0ABQ3UWM5_9CHLR|nr:TetR/AcrR family transcriptional regulator [Ktedonobacter robiniae]GHO56740.1 TetR family transcriptional regulator [Ktedonobacter robiniae]